MLNAPLELPNGGLRSWWRHERMTVAAELAVALHHSVVLGLQYRTKPHGDRRLRAQWEGGRVSLRNPCRQWRWSTRFARAPGLLS